MHPRRVFTPSFKLCSLQEQSNEDFLRGVASVFRISHESIADSPDAVLKPFDECHEGRAVRTFAGCFGSQLLVAEVSYCHNQFHMGHPADCCFSFRLVRCQRNEIGHTVRFAH